MTREREFVPTLSCRDTTGIVHAASGLLYQAGCNIIDSQPSGAVEDRDGTAHFFMRAHFAAPERLADAVARGRLCGRIRQPFGKPSGFHASGRRSVVLMSGHRTVVFR